MNSPPQFHRHHIGMKDIAIALSLCAAGIGLLAAARFNSFRLNVEGAPGLVTFHGMVFAGGAILCAGLLSPFKHQVVGLILGFLLVFPVMFYLRLL